MAMNLLRGKSRRAIGPEASRDYAIGETDAQVFNCPACARPLAEGTWRCPGCGVRLIMGVKLRRAGAILALGIVLGVIGGGVAMSSAITGSLREARTATAAASTAPASPSVSAAPSEPVATPVLTAPQAAVSALSGTAVVNGRIAVDAATLSRTLARSGATTTEIARALRSLAADAALGIDLTDRLMPWREAAPVMKELDGFYRTMAGTARDALRVSLADKAGYRRSGAGMLTVLAALGDVDAVSRVLATTVDLELPPVALPGSTP